MIFNFGPHCSFLIKPFSFSQPKFLALFLQLTMNNPLSNCKTHTKSQLRPVGGQHSAIGPGMLVLEEESMGGTTTSTMVHLLLCLEPQASDLSPRSRSSRNLLGLLSRVLVGISKENLWDEPQALLLELVSA